MGLLDRLKKPNKEHHFCSMCGAPMASFEKVIWQGYDQQTGEPEERVMVGWACSDVTQSPAGAWTTKFHDGWDAYYWGNWQKLDG
jgi:hypothetical protein